MQKKILNRKIGIIGGGPAGCSVALQLLKYNINPIIFEKKGICSLLKNPYLIENYLGFPEGIKGNELRKKIIKQLKGIKIIYEEVIDLEYDKGFLTKTTENVYKFDILVIATGTKPQKFPKDFNSKKIFYDVFPLLNSPFKDILIIGGGDIAFDYTLNLSSKGKKVVIINRKNKPKCNQKLYKNVLANKKIRLIPNTEVIDIVEDNKKLRISFSSRKKFYNFDAVLIAIGRTPETGFFSKNFKEIISNLTKEKKLYFTGDVKNGIYRQISIASGDGIKTGMRIYEDHFKER